MAIVVADLHSRHGGQRHWRPGQRLAFQKYGLSIGRKLIGVTCLTISGLLLFAVAFMPGKYIVAALLILCFGITDGMLPCSWAFVSTWQAIFGRQRAHEHGGQAAGYISTVLYGYLVTWSDGNYDRPLLFLAPSLLVSAVLFALIDPTRPLVPEYPDSAPAD
jgi:hypothetical protein